MNTVGSSDIETARTLSRQLAGLDPDRSLDHGPSRYLKIHPSDATPREGNEATTRPIQEQPQDFRRWDEFLAWSREIARSSAAFVIDPQGFVIGSSGDVPEDGFEGTGAELSYVMSQADVMTPEMGALRSIGLEFSGRRVSGFRTDVAEAEGFVVAFIDAEPLSEATQRQIARQLEHSFGVLL